MVNQFGTGLAIKVSMKLTIFGANLKDQSKGQFVVHAADCADCKKLARETADTGEFESMEAVSKYIFHDMINEGGMTVRDGLGEIHFAPCVKLPETV